MMRKIVAFLPVLLLFAGALQAGTSGGDISKKRQGHDGAAEMVLVEGGSFAMGVDKEGASGSFSNDNSPAHTVTVNSFYLDKYEVTNTAFCGYLNTLSPNDPESVAPVMYHDIDIFDYANGKYTPKAGKGNLPVVEVTWEGAKGYAEWAGKRLPTEAEWEFAARGGNLSNGYTYSGGGDLAGVACLNVEEGVPCPVGSKQPNELGLYDMTGNVWEWCEDWYHEKFYQSGETDNPVSTKPNKDHVRVLRGGGCLTAEEELGITFRGCMKPAYSNGESGFRCAKNE